MKNVFICFVLVFCAVITGCSTAAQKQLAQNLQQKSIMGEGLVTVNEITVTSPETGTYTPELKSIFINGKFMSLLKDVNLITYDRKSSSSTFNSSAVTTTETLVIQTSRNSDLSAVVEKLGKLMGSGANKGSTATETPSKATD